MSDNQLGVRPGPRVAFLTHTPPRPLISGERIRNWHLIRELADRGWGVSLFSLLQRDAVPGTVERAHLEDVCSEVIFAPFNVGGLRRRARVLRNLALRRAFQTDFFLTRAAATSCWRWLDARGFDVVVVSQLYMAPYVFDEILPHAVLDAHNSEARRVATIAATLGHSPKGVVASLQKKPVAEFERGFVERIARVAAVSKDDLVEFEPFAPGRVDLVPNGVDCRKLRPRSRLPRKPGILFIGSLDYSANVDAVVHLAQDILPLLHHGDAAVTVVGSKPGRNVYAAARRSPIPMHVAGQVPDATPHWEAARLLVVPMRIGGGTRLKILEALARGVPVVTTTLGCEGLDVRHGEDLLIADGPAEFAAAVERLLADDELCLSLAARGRATVEARYDWRAIGETFEQCLVAAA